MKRILYLLTLSIFLFTLSCEKEEELIDLNAEKNPPKVEVCHYDAYTDTWTTISISQNALKAHLAHGDFEGACDQRKTYVPDDGFEQLLINLGYDDILDNYVLTSNINTITTLIIPKYENLNKSGYTESQLKDIKTFIALSSVHPSFANKNKPSNQKMNNNYISKSELKTSKGFKDLASNIDIVKDLNITMSSALGEVNYPIYDLTGIEDFISLVTLEMYSDNVSSLILTNNIALKYLTLMGKSLVELNITNNKLLTELKIHFSNLPELNLTNNSNLEVFWFNDNQDIQILDLTKNIALIELKLSNVPVPDLTKNTALLNLSFDTCRGAFNLDLTKNTKLLRFLSYQSLENTLNLSQNLELISLTIWDEFGMSTLDIESNTKLSQLYISLTGITQLNLTKHVFLKELKLHLVPLTTLDLKNNIELTTLQLSRIPLTTLDLKNNIELTTLYLHIMGISQLDLKSGNSQLIQSFEVTDTGLDCIQVDDAVYSSANWTNIDPGVVFSEDCGY